MSFWRRVLRERAEGDDGVPPPPLDAGPTVGEQLRERRIARGLTSTDVERDTRINRLYIEALEEGDFQALPAPVYARGFLRSYARYLGFDPELAVQAIPRDLPRPRGLEPLPGLRRATAATMPAFTPGVRLVLVAIAVALIALLAWFAWQLGGDDAPGISIATSTPPPTATATAPPGAAAAGGGVPVPAATVPPFTPGTVPDFRGVDRDAAVATSESLRLVPLVVEETNASPAGRVFDQSPQPATAAQENDIITLFVSTGPGD